jgi:hypothetical protein
MRRTLRGGIAATALFLLPIMASQAQQPVPPDCAQNAPVCGLKDGSRQTYWNACLAARDGAQFLNIGECRSSRSYGMHRTSPAPTRF